MGTYDLKRLEIAIQYIRRMSEGKTPSQTGLFRKMKF